MALIGLALDSHSKPRQNVSMQPFILHTTTAIIFCKDYLKKYTIHFINSCWELSFQLGCLKLYRCAGFYVTATPTLKGSRHPFRPKMLGYVNAKNSLEHLVDVTFINYFPWFPQSKLSCISVSLIFKIYFTKRWFLPPCSQEIIALPLPCGFFSEEGRSPKCWEQFHQTPISFSA